jgi:hypothetical protein
MAEKPKIERRPLVAEGEPHGLASMVTHRDAEYPDEKPDEETVAQIETTQTVAGGPATDATVKASEADAASADEARAATD